MLFRSQTTFSYKQLLDLYSKEQFTLGSRGRFEHPIYGLIRATFVKFTSMLPGIPTGGPVGFITESNGVNWTATNDLMNSSANLAAGFLASIRVPQDGQFGWVITSGPNLLPIRIANGVTSKVGNELVWSGANEVTNAGSGIAIARQAANGDKINTFAVGEIYIEVSSASGEAGLSAPNAKISILETGLGTANARITNVETVAADNVSAQAQVNSSLTAGIGSNTTEITDTKKVFADRDKIIAEELRRVEGSIEGRAQFLIDISSQAQADRNKVIYSRIESVDLKYRAEGDSSLQSSAKFQQSLDVLAIESKASISLTTALSVSVASNEQGVSGNAQNITTLQADVSTNGNGITAVGNRTTILETTVNDANSGVVANSTAVTSLNSLTQTQGNDISSQGGRITSLETSISNLPVNIDEIGRASCRERV